MNSEKQKELASKLEPKHLQEEPVLDVQAEKESLERRLPELKSNQTEEATKPRQADPRLQKKYPFKFEWKDGRGKVWKGDFVNEVLSIGKRQMAGVLQAKLAAGVPMASLDSLTIEINLMVAHMTYSLVERPEWAQDLLALDDVRLLQELYSEVIAHEATFLGYQQPETES